MRSRAMTWVLRHADGGPGGTAFARATLEAEASILIHAAPDRLGVEVVDEEGARVATDDDLRPTADTPMCRLRIEGSRVVRDDVWPGDEDLGAIVVLAGGEAGRLLAWSVNADRTRWRWSLELTGGS